MGDMAQQTRHEVDGQGIKDFFARCGLPGSARLLCWELARTRYPETTNIQETPNQGFCSYTLNLDSHTVLQFRPAVHKLDLEIITLAKQAYGNLVPLTEFIGVIILREDGRDNHASLLNKTLSPSLLVYSISRIQGVSLAEFNHLSTRITNTHETSTQQHREALIKSFASFVSQGLSSPSTHQLAPRGRIGKSIRWRLETMHRDLPLRFRPTVQTILDALPRIEALPWVLTHGDLVPSNILVEPELQLLSSSSTNMTYTIRGLIDWAEAEYLPFGVGIYGLEEFLGVQVPDASTVTTTATHRQKPLSPTLDASPLPHQITTTNNKSPSPPTTGKKYPPPFSKFIYLPNQATLRDLFWNELHTRITQSSSSHHPEQPSHPQPLIPTNTPTSPSSSFLETVKLARLLGILLWHGIAFDDGRLDRVVREGTDDEEIQRLDVTLFGAETERDYQGS